MNKNEAMQQLAVANGNSAVMDFVVNQYATSNNMTVDQAKLDLGLDVAQQAQPSAQPNVGQQPQTVIGGNDDADAFFAQLGAGVMQKIQSASSVSLSSIKAKLAANRQAKPFSAKVTKLTANFSGTDGKAVYYAIGLNAPTFGVNKDTGAFDSVYTIAISAIALRRMLETIGILDPKIGHLTDMQRDANGFAFYNLPELTVIAESVLYGADITFYAEAITQGQPYPDYFGDGSNVRVCDKPLSFTYTITAVSKRA